MTEIASITHSVLSQLKAATTNAGAPSKAKYLLEDSVKETARARVADLLKDFPLYPELGQL